MRMAFLVIGDLLQRHRLHIVAQKHLLMPADNARERGRQVPARMPAQPGAGLGAVEFEVMGFVRMAVLFVRIVAAFEIKRGCSASMAPAGASST